MRAVNAIVQIRAIFFHKEDRIERYELDSIWTCGDAPVVQEQSDMGGTSWFVAEEDFIGFIFQSVGTDFRYGDNVFDTERSEMGLDGLFDSSDAEEFRNIAKNLKKENIDTLSFLIKFRAEYLTYETLDGTEYDINYYWEKMNESI
jgi:hypothetical protein